MRWNHHPTPEDMAASWPLAVVLAVSIALALGGPLLLLFG
jgi:hypothetical protein